MTAQELERDYNDYVGSWVDLWKAGLHPRHKPLTLAEYVVEGVLPELEVEPKDTLEALLRWMREEQCERGDVEMYIEELLEYGT